MSAGAVLRDDGSVGAAPEDGEIGPFAPCRPATAADGVELAALASRRRGTAPRGQHRMQVLCAGLGSPQLTLPAIHIVGTDGKSSVARIVTALLEAVGIATGETTSPHLTQLRERIRIHGRLITDEALARVSVRLTAALAEVDRRVGEPATFFEAVTATALAAFVDAGVEVAVVEAGIGGAGDATRVVRGRVTVVTPVSDDHPELGTTTAEIAREKAAVVTPGGVMVSSAQLPEVEAVLARVAAAHGARHLRAGHDFGVLARQPVTGGQRVALRGLDGAVVEAVLPLRGAHQAANAATALAAVQACLGTTDLDPAALGAGLATVTAPGRVELVPRAGVADVVIDGAHDVSAVRALVATLRELGPVGTCIAVLGVGAGRDPRPLARLLGEFCPVLVATEARAPSATRAEIVADLVRGEVGEVVVTPAVTEAIAAASARVPADGLVVVAGSLHLAGEARDALVKVRT